mmetsp:Transcript_48041/g.89523  ORF Transcript_48041/g.89523 Transcript_48041/m.89523 type:complete len:209 (+) Transcript_48041:104-730(+)
MERLPLVLLSPALEGLFILSGCGLTRISFSPRGLFPGIVGSFVIICLLAAPPPRWADLSFLQVGREESGFVDGNEVDALAWVLIFDSGCLLSSVFWFRASGISSLTIALDTGSGSSWADGRMSGEVDKTLDTSALDFGTTELLSGLLLATLLNDRRDPCMLPLSARADILSKVLLTFSSLSLDLPVLLELQILLANSRACIVDMPSIF